MSGIARIMLARGLPVSGSDAKDSVALAALRALGATVHVGHDAGNVGDGRHRRRLHRDPRDQPRAGRGAPARAAASCTGPARWPSVMVGRRAVAVAGTHGKTTTTSMLTVALQHCGADPSFAIGGNLNESGANAHNGSGDVFVAEADESDGSFLLLRADRRGRHQRRARPPRPLRHRRGGRGRPSTRSPDGSSRAASSSSAPTTRARPARRVGARRPASTSAPTASARPPTCGWSTCVTKGLGSSFEAVAARPPARPGASCGCPGRHNALNAAAALDGRRSGSASRSSGCARGWRLHRHPAAVRAQGHRRRRPGLRQLRPPPDRAAADLTAAREVAGGGRVVVGVPAAPVQPHPGLRRPSSARRSGWPTRSS